MKQSSIVVLGTSTPRTMGFTERTITRGLNRGKVVSTVRVGQIRKMLIVTPFKEVPLNQKIDEIFRSLPVIREKSKFQLFLEKWFPWACFDYEDNTQIHLDQLVVIALEV